MYENMYKYMNIYIYVCMYVCIWQPCDIEVSSPDHSLERTVEPAGRLKDIPRASLRFLLYVIESVKPYEPSGPSDKNLPTFRFLKGFAISLPVIGFRAGRLLGVYWYKASHNSRL